MSGRTFTYTTGFDSFVKTLLPDVEAPLRRKAGGVGDGMLRDVEEFINRFCVTAANDDGDLTFDAAGTYTFDGALVVNGDATVNGDMTLGGTGVFQTDTTGNRAVLAADATGYSDAGVFLYPGTSDFGGSIYSVESGGKFVTTVVAPSDTAESPAFLKLYNDSTLELYGDVTMSSGIVDGDATTPGIKFANDPNTGMYLYGTDQIGFTAGGSVRFRVGTAAHVSTEPLQNPSGSASAPAFTFSTDTNTGMYRYGTDQIGFTAGGSVRFRVGTTAHISTEPFQTADGAVTACAYSFSSDTNTGMFRNSGSSFLGLAWNGSTGLAIRSTDVIPGSDNTKNLGDTSFRWVDVWAVDSTINTSDARDKREVTDLDLGLDFVMQLRPVHYKWNDRGGYVGTRKHHGFVAQEVATALGPEAANRGLWISAPGRPADPGMPDSKPTPPREALRPAELIPVLTKAIQELTARVEALETP